MNTKRLHKASKRRRQVYLRKLSLVLASVIVIIGLSISFAPHLVDAHESEPTVVSEKLYKSIEIESGDSLWSIAEEYRDHNAETVFEYIDTLKEINSLHSDDIHEGQYLTVVYYEAL